MIVFAIEGRSFEAGKPLCKEVEAATSALAETVLGEAIELARANPENSPYSSSASKRSK